MFPESVPLFSGVLPKYFNSEWSVAQFRLHENIQYIVAFGHQKNTVVILGMDGRYVSSIFHVNILYLCMYIAYSWSGDYFHLSECILYSKTLRRVKQRQMDPQGFSCFALIYTLLIIDLVIPWVVLAVSLDASSILWQVGR